MSDDLLVKYLLKEVSASEAALVDAWIAERPQHAHYYNDFKIVWEESRKLAGRSNVNVDEAWDRFQGLVAKETKPRSVSLTRPALSIAAGLALLIGGTLLYLLLNKESERLIVQSGMQIQTVKLPDGSFVTLNKGSELSYPKVFSGPRREVMLQGEAFLEVVPDKTHPFIVSANVAQIKVVGTSFNIKTRDTATEVIVTTGIVEVTNKVEMLQLLPNEATTVYKGRAGLAKRKAQDQLYNYYRTKEFVCNNTPLERLADVLSEAYNIQIDIIDPALRKLPLTVTFRNESLNEVLLVISETLNIRAEQSGKRVILSPR
jgi:transmembrane sensor